MATDPEPAVPAGPAEPDEQFHHIDQNTLALAAPPTPNPLAR